MEDLPQVGTGTIEILCNPVRISETKALEKREGLFYLLLFGHKRERRATLLYKPFWYSEAKLPDTSGLNKSRNVEIVVMMDSLTGVVRHWEKERELETITMNIEKEKVYRPEVNEGEANKLTKRFLQRLYIKESRGVQDISNPKLIFRPVWLVENLRKGRCYTVDAYTGYVSRNFTV